MASIKCPNCLATVDSDTKSCPYCASSINAKEKIPSTTEKLSDRTMLINLRNNLYALPQAKKALTNAKKQLDKLEDKAERIQYDDEEVDIDPPEYWVRTRAMEQEYARKFREANKEREARKREKASHRGETACAMMKLLRVVLVIAAIIVPIVAAILLYKYQRLGYTFFVEHQWEGWLFNDWDGPVGLYTYIGGGIVAIGLISLLIYKITDDAGSRFGSALSEFIGIAAMIVATLGLLVSGFIFLKIWWGVHGWWWIVAWVPALVASAFLPIILIARLAFAVLVSFVVLLIIAGVPMLVVLFCNAYDDIECSVSCAVSTVTKDEIDLTPLRETEEYQAAYEQDDIDNDEIERRFEQALEEARTAMIEEYAVIIKDQKELVASAQRHVSACTKAIADCPIHESYKNIQTINWLLYYFEYNLATTMKEAANLMRTDIKMQQFQELLKRQHSEILAGQRAIRSDLQRYNSEMAERWQEFQSTCERQHNESLAAVQRMESTQLKIAERSRAAIADAQSSIRSAIGNLQTESHHNADYVVQQMKEYSDK